LYACIEAAVPTLIDPVIGQPVCVIAPVGVARKVPTFPVMVPLVQVTAALPSTVKPVVWAGGGGLLLALRLELTLALRLALGEVMLDAGSPHAAESSAKVTRAPAARLAGVSARTVRIGRL
jgi:hypothetical protein